MKFFVFIGIPGCGKGTFGKLIADKLSWKHVSMGDLIRTEISMNTELGLNLKHYSSLGVLIPDDTADQIMFPHISNVTQDIILDGYPRTIDQANYISKFCLQNNHQILAINISLEIWIAVKKIMGRRKCSTCNRDFNTVSIVQDTYQMPAILPDKQTCPIGEKNCNPVLLKSRSDDNEITIQNRLREYDEKTIPILNYFHQNRALRTFIVKKGVADTDSLISLMLS